GKVVGRAPVLGVLAPPEHPYPEALLAALPQVEESDVRQRLAAIPGRPPSLLDPPPTCRFAPRCAYASLDDGCAASMPELREIRPSHFVRSAHPCSERARLMEAVR